MNWDIIYEELEKANPYKEIGKFSANELADLFYLFRDKSSDDPWFGIIMYFGITSDYNNKYYINILKPFKDFNVIILINNTLGGELYAHESRFDSVYQCIVDSIHNYSEKYLNGVSEFYIDYGWYTWQIERQIEATYTGIGATLL